MVMEEDAILDPFWIANQSYQHYLDTNDCKKKKKKLKLYKKRTQERHELHQKRKKI